MINLKGLPEINIKAVAIITVLQIVIGIIAVVCSLGDSSDPSHVYPIDIYTKIYRFPLGYIFNGIRSGLLFVVDLLIWAVAIERIISITGLFKRSQ